MTLGGHLYIVMELLEGAPLSEHITSLKVREGRKGGGGGGKRGGMGKERERARVGRSWEGEREGGREAH